MKNLGLGIAIAGSGSATPTQVLSNDDLSRIVDTSDEWISSRTGIKNRRIASNEESLADLAARAGQNAIAAAGLAADDIDLIILATSTSDDLFGTAARVQHLIGATQAAAFDLTAACSGFVFGLVTASQFIYTGAYRNILLIGADILSRWVDWNDRATCILFGDGAGAVVLQASDRDRLLGFALSSDGSQNQELNLAYQAQPNPLTDNITTSTGGYQAITMNGREVYRFAVAKVPDIISKALFRANLEASAIDWLLLHQANQRILDAVASRLDIPSEKTISNLANYGNTSAASIPIALDEAVRSGKIKPGDTIAASGFGAGLTWGAAIFQWGKE
ncbi:beta-ketoacyl-ACP synthase III [Oscillatoria sp. FACHB-1406]|uniref:beta-ketoacyl-ACP synthase III n=1 Tax=Oscillatoria sp. FACHB-1406 TaxID=2692846 RepID=UPI0016852747|nr:beta-ketoacyl-ACP synthase III [Oscillatoria sp. FACHB-1406]MBD2579817.1 ketoacyl-ACP synthase III [Oscillatoria sp. FACHB-1406]